ncbi:MAG: hypothetical protein WDN69_30445 [Aliidongia sp.]
MKFRHALFVYSYDDETQTVGFMDPARGTNAARSEIARPDAVGLRVCHAGRSGSDHGDEGGGSAQAFLQGV